MSKAFYDCHCHIEYSHDSTEKLSNLCDEAKIMGLCGISVTDHCDIQHRNVYDVKTPILNSADDAKEMDRMLDGKLRVFSGVEMGEALWCIDYANDIIAARDYDVVLGSVHAVRCRFTDEAYSRIDFSSFSQSDIDEYLSNYFDDMQQTIEKCDFDVLCHLTCPLTYIIAKYKLNADIDKHIEKIDAILKEIIRKNIAFEINTTTLKNPAFGETLPNFDIVKRYLDFGGDFITLGADSHIAPNVAYGFKEVAEKLKGMGVKKLHYFEKRKPHSYLISGE